METTNHIFFTNTSFLLSGEISKYLLIRSTKKNNVNLTNITLTLNSKFTIIESKKGDFIELKNFDFLRKGAQKNQTHFKQLPFLVISACSKASIMRFDINEFTLINVELFQIEACGSVDISEMRIEKIQISGTESLIKLKNNSLVSLLRSSFINNEFDNKTSENFSFINTSSSRPKR